MRPQHIHAKTKKIFISQRGNILILSLYIIILVLVLAFGMVEIGKVMVTKEKLQTAADAAALEVGSMESYREVKILVHTERAGKWIPGDEDTPGHCKVCGSVTRGPFTGSEAKLLEQGQWRTRCARSCPDNCAPYRCWYEIVDRNMMYDGNYMSTEMSQGQINMTLFQNARYLRQDLLWSVAEKDESILATMLENNPKPEDIKYLLADKNRWINTYLNKNGYRSYCNYDCQYYLKYYGIKSYEYNRCQRSLSACQLKQSQMTGFYNQYSEKLRKIVNEQVESDKQLVEWNNQRINPTNLLKTFIASKNSPIFNLNRPLEGNKNQGSSYANQAVITGAKAYDFKRGGVQSPYYPSVVVVATATVSNWFYNSSNKLFSVGPEEWVIKVCSQSSTSYRDAKAVAGQEFDHSSQHKGVGSWFRIPDDACQYWEKYGKLP